MYCPKCNSEVGEGFSECYRCGFEFADCDNIRWVTLGDIEDRVFAGLARETLKSMGIPAVIVSRSGFFGNVGLTLNPFFNARRRSSFEVSVPWPWREEASDALVMVLGNRFSRRVA